MSAMYMTFWTISADDVDGFFYILFFPENRLWHFMQIVSWGENLHEMSEPIFWEN